MKFVLKCLAGVPLAAIFARGIGGDFWNSFSGFAIGWVICECIRWFVAWNKERHRRSQLPIWVPLIGLACLSVPAHGGDCVHGFRHHHGYRQHHVVKQLVVTPLYFAGAGLEQEALIERSTKKAVAEAITANDAKWQGVVQQLKADFLRFKAEGTFTINGEAAVDGVAEAAGGQALPDATAAAITRSCIDCHGPNKQSGGLDLTQPITDARIAAEIGTRVVSDDPEYRMPPSGTIEPADRQALFDYSVNLSKALRRVADQ